jgi:predicted amidohydrolase
VFFSSLLQLAFIEELPSELLKMSQVGFQFQGDVFHGGSLIFSAAGRLMKELSDGGVDIYALGALVHLGHQVPMSQRQETIVATCMQKRSRTRNG